MNAPRDDEHEGNPEDGPPEFGPSGYLPERAAKRARKIVLRAPLGIQWVIASVVAGVVVLAAGIVFLVAGDDPPGDPYVAIGPVEDLAALEPLPDLDATVLTHGGRVRVFADTQGLELTLCPDTNRLGGADDRVWTLTGRGLGNDSLAEHPAVVHGGTLYVDPTRTVPGPTPDEAPPAEPTCPG